MATATGVLPAAAFGGAVMVGVRLDSTTAFFIEGRALRSLPSAQSPRGSIGGTLIAPGLLACRLIDNFGACALAQLGWQSLSSSGVSDPRASSALYGAIGVRFRLALPLTSDWALWLGAEGLANLTRNSAVLSGGEVWITGPASASLLLGVEAHLL